MPNPWFQFKQFTVWQNMCAMKVGTDGVLLGAWTNIGAAKKMLDIGTGTGLIALMLAQRSEAMVDAVEIDNNAAVQANENVKRSPWPDRIKVFCQSFQEYSKKTGQYDLIVTNPPYFSNALKAPNEQRAIARHNHILTISDLVDGISQILSDNGRFSIILPVEDFSNLYKIACVHGLFMIRQTRVKPTPDKDSIRVLAEFSRKPADLAKNELIIEQGGRHQYSMEYIELTKDFYLKM